MIKAYLKTFKIVSGSWLLVLITALAIFITSKRVFAENKLQLKLNDTVSVYSEKAYRRDGGTYFEAVGNVVVISGNDTLYGEKASFNTKTGEVSIEGSIRYISQNMTIYGVKIDYNMISQSLVMQNARMITPEFSIVAARIEKKSQTIYLANEAEFTTCKDCTESWQVYGKKVEIELNRYVQLHHALVKVKGVDVLYLPYIALPIKNKRESGVLFPRTSTRNQEGIRYEQPFYWAISEDKDMTISPTFLAERGYGLNLEYRQAFSEKTWLESYYNGAVDKIYFPGKEDSEDAPNFYRQFFSLENHYQPTLNYTQHLQLLAIKDLDYFSDYNIFTSQELPSNDLGLEFFADQRFDKFSLGVETYYKRNLLDADPIGFDSSYVQTLPKVNFSYMPSILFQADRNYFYRSLYGVEGDITNFKQNRFDEEENLRNATRLDLSPFVSLGLLNYGPFTLKTRYQVDYQAYKFLDEDENNFYKNSGLVSTEFSFTVDKIFGLAYEEKYNQEEFSEKDLQRLSGDRTKSNTNILSKNIIGELPKIEGSIKNEKITIRSNSYRHSQEFRFIHHQLVHSGESGNDRFEDQIQQEQGWFDYRDAVTENLVNLASNEARKDIPLENTLEIQWKNVLVKKSAKKFNFLLDDKYLKDNFQYTQVGYFNISQGILLVNSGEELGDKLTRLYLSTGYNGNTWNLRFDDYYIHSSSDHILTFSLQKRFNSLSLLGEYRYNSFPDSSLKTVKAGFQFRPIDTLGFSILREHDLDVDENISSIYQIDIMPNNNCWVANLSLKESILGREILVKYVFNFGQDEFKNYRRDYFSFRRLE